MLKTLMLIAGLTLFNLPMQTIAHSNTGLNEIELQIGAESLPSDFFDNTKWMSGESEVSLEFLGEEQWKMKLGEEPTSGAGWVFGHQYLYLCAKVAPCSVLQNKHILQLRTDQENDNRVILKLTHPGALPQGMSKRTVFLAPVGK